MFNSLGIFFLRCYVIVVRITMSILMTCGDNDCDNDINDGIVHKEGPH